MRTTLLLKLNLGLRLNILNRKSTSTFQRLNDLEALFLYKRLENVVFLPKLFQVQARWKV
ncbi:MAG: hypothetical protein L3J66_05705 [Bacteroidales bacterium]|nr:hypothetical protein [Bacteroidales bacterium]